MKRTIVIGDVHGCFDEMCLLLEDLKFDNLNDRVIFCGDLVDRGPSSLDVVEFVKNNKLECVMGNHEEKHIRFRKWEKSGKKNPMVMPAYKHHHLYSDELIDFMASFPTLIRFSVKEQDFIVVHAGFECNGVPPDDQKQSLVIRLRNVDEYGEQDESQDRHWSTMWNRREHVLYGHNVTLLYAPLLNVKEKTGYCLGLDTGCVFGGCLTAFVIHEDGHCYVKSVKAKKDYWKRRDLQEEDR